MRAPRIYVAGSSAQPERAAAAIAAVRAAGGEITHDWTVDVLNPAIGPQNWTAPRESALDWATKDMEAIGRSDAVLVLMPGPEARPSFGAGWECGFATALGVPIVASGAGSIFLVFAAEVCETDHFAVHAVLDRARRAMENYASDAVHQDGPTGPAS